ncbi:hypothetical protein BKA63DRAFT_290227 [Paraphoma chrysanthemicola]|nr:hypothetical protein BKA63DRAFT_290227 [Paraphoma chrysanthemicola]
MYRILFHLLLSVHISLAAKWAIDGSCDLIATADKGIGQNSFIPGTDELKEAVKEGISMAESAVLVMSYHKDDQHVKDMLKLVLGEGAEYQSKFDAFKRTFENVMGFDRDHAVARPMDPDWQETMTNKDVMIFCSNDRLQQTVPGTTLYFDQSMKDTRYFSVELEKDAPRGRCHSTEYNLESTAGLAMAFTTASDRYNKEAYIKAPKPKRIEDFGFPRENIACSIDLCNWFMHRSLLQGWPRISTDRVKQTQQPGFRGGIVSFVTPVDGLRNTGLTMLHELTHTVQGGRLSDIRDLPPGTPSCYGWRCIQDLKDPTNSDNVAMLGLALHLWTMGYYVDQDGNVKDK